MLEEYLQKPEAVYHGLCSFQLSTVQHNYLLEGYAKFCVVGRMM
jgi:hypothetical protein